MSTQTPTKAAHERQIIEKWSIQPAGLSDLTQTRRNRMFPKLTTGLWEVSLFMQTPPAAPAINIFQNRGVRSERYITGYLVLQAFPCWQPLFLQTILYLCDTRSFTGFGKLYSFHYAPIMSLWGLPSSFLDLFPECLTWCCVMLGRQQEQAPREEPRADFYFSPVIRAAQWPESVCAAYWIFSGSDPQ